MIQVNDLFSFLTYVVVILRLVPMTQREVFEDQYYTATSDNNNSEIVLYLRNSFQGLFDIKTPKLAKYNIFSDSCRSAADISFVPLSLFSIGMKFLILCDMRTSSFCQYFIFVRE